MAIEIDWDEEKPKFSKVKELLERGVFTVETLSTDGVNAVVQEFIKLNKFGDCKFISATFIDDPVLNWFIARNRFDELHFFEKFVQCSFFEEQGLKYNKSFRSIRWNQSSSYTLDGEIAHALMFGGAYNDFEGTGEQAKRLGMDFCRDLFGTRYEQVNIYTTEKRWSKWFFDIAWDNTWIGVDKENHRIWALIATDTD